MRLQASNNLIIPHISNRSPKSALPAVLKPTNIPLAIYQQSGLFTIMPLWSNYSSLRTPRLTDVHLVRSDSILPNETKITVHSNCTDKKLCQAVSFYPKAARLVHWSCDTMLATLSITYNSWHELPCNEFEKSSLPHLSSSPT